MEPVHQVIPAPAPIDGVIVHPLHPIPDERGRLMEILRRDDPIFERFAYAYVTSAYPGVVKAWHLHRRQTDNLVVLAGLARIGLYDLREGSPTRGRVQEVFAGVHAPVLVRIPPGVLHGFKAVGPDEALVLNLPTELYDPADPDEYRLPPDDPSIPFCWDRRDG